jgi:hypothetical protein
LMLWAVAILGLFSLAMIRRISIHDVPPQFPFSLNLRFFSFQIP